MPGNRKTVRAEGNKCICFDRYKSLGAGLWGIASRMTDKQTSSEIWHVLIKYFDEPTGQVRS